MSRNIRVMIVEDHPLNLKLAKDLLEIEGYDVQACPDAERALEVLSEELPELILMDVALPGMDGLELTRRLKSDARTSGIKIVALTAFAKNTDRDRVINAGCDGYIAKPINTRILSSLILEHLNEP